MKQKRNLVLNIGTDMDLSSYFGMIQLHILLFSYNVIMDINIHNSYHC